MPGWFGPLIYCNNGDFTNFLKLVPECPVECGGVGQILFGQCPNVGGVNAKGCSLSSKWKPDFKTAKIIIRVVKLLAN